MSLESEDPIGHPREARHPRVRKTLKPFLAGMATVIPVLATGWIVVLVFRLLHKIGLALIYGILDALNWVRGVKPGSDAAWKLGGFHGDDFLWLLIPLALLFLVGIAVTNRPGKKITQWIDDTIIRIPFFGFIYASIKQIVDAIRNLGGTQKFKGVAFIEYPSPGCRLIGFITGNFRDTTTDKGVTSVFIPTSPNPMTGFVVLVDDDKVMRCDMTLEEAGKLILSAGLVAPESLVGSAANRASVPGDPEGTSPPIPKEAENPS